MALPPPAPVDGGGALVGRQEGVQGLAQRQQAVVETPHSCKEIQDSGSKGTVVALYHCILQVESFIESIGEFIRIFQDLMTTKRSAPYHFVF